MYKENILGFDLFIWTDWSPIDSNTLMFHETTFIPNSLKEKFDNCDLEVTRNGKITVYKNSLIEQLDLFTVPEFRDYLHEKLEHTMPL